MTTIPAPTDISLAEFRRLRPLLVAHGHKGMTNEEHLAIIDGVRAGGRRAKELLVLAHEGMLHAFVDKCRRKNYNTDIAELYHEAIIALWYWALKWEPSKGNFYGYVNPSLRHVWAFPNSGADSVITVSLRAYAAARRAVAAKQTRNIVSFDEPHADPDEDLTLADVLATEQDDIGDWLEHDENHLGRMLIEEFTATLSSNQLETFRRVMIDGETLQTVGDDHGLTRQAIHQRTQLVKEKLAKFMKARTGIEPRLEDLKYQHGAP